MSNKTLNSRIVIKNDTAANWTTNSSYVLLKGEFGVESDTGKFKIGDGTSTWAQLTYRNVRPEDITNTSADMTKAVYDINNNGKVDVAELADAATKLATTRTIAISGAVTGTATSFDGSGNVTIPTTSLDATKLSGVVPVVNGGTGASTVAGAQTNLGIDLKANIASPTLTGTPAAPTATAGTNTTQIATTAFVTAAINTVLSASNAMVFQGTIGTGGTVTALPNTHQVGDVYVVKTAGSYAGTTCEVGDMIICVTTGTAANNADWDVIQTNIDGAVTGPSSSVINHVAIFNTTTGKVIADSGYTIATSVPSGAVFTDEKVTTTVSNTTKTYFTGSSSSSATNGYENVNTNTYAGIDGYLYSKNNNAVVDKLVVVEGDNIILDGGTSSN